MSAVLINNLTDTYTATHSGAIATFLWECCGVARAEGLEPTVISRNGEGEPYPWRNTILLDYPRTPRTQLGVGMGRIERKISGWRDIGQRSFAGRIVRAIEKAKLAAGPFSLHNDPELAVLLKRRYPTARVTHHFHNQLRCKEVFRAAFRDAEIVVTAVSDFTARWVEKFYGLKFGTVKTIYNGVDSKRFFPAKVEAGGLPVIGFVGRTGVEKAPDLLLRAARELSRKTRAFEVQIVGTNHWGRLEMDDYQRELQSLAADVEAAGVKVRRCGFVERAAMPDALRAAHIHVVPSRWDEPFGLTTVEGMASGLAVVGSRTGGTPEVVGDAGLLFERESVEGLSDCLEQLITDPHTRSEYGKRARARAETFTWDKTWAQLRKAMGL